MAKQVDRIAVIRSMYTEAINHGPGVTFLQTGSPFPGRPSMGAWASYGLGSENENLPTYVAISDIRGEPPNGKANWSNGFLPAKFQGTPLLRGVYFTSGTQEGTPMGRVLNRMGQAMGINPPQFAQQQQVESKSYFLRDMFMNVVFPDGNPNASGSSWCGIQFSDDRRRSRKPGDRGGARCECRRRSYR